MGLVLAWAVVAAGPALAQDVGPKVDAPGRLAGPPPSVDALAYDSRLLSSAAAAQRFQGPLDGGWTLSADGQGDLYGFQLVDRRDELEGAWRDLQRPRQAGASGFLEEIQRTSDGVVMRFSSAPEAVVLVRLHPDGAAIRGELERAGQLAAVRLRRTGP